MNKTISRYLNKNILYPRLIADTPSKNLGIIVVIPCYDEPDICNSILAIAKCEVPNCSVEVIVSINAGIFGEAQVKENNLKSKKDILALDPLPNWLKVFPIVNNELPTKKAGVGLGRKIGMDEAVQRYLELEKEDGIIVCFDADSECTPNYLKEIESHFKTKSIASASINYEHPIEGSTFSTEIYNSIIQYELHLRYFIQMQKALNLPYAYHTVGSSMACTVLAYCSVGGMNQRKAGEDFYFIHKLVKFGKHSELNATKVIPSPRISDRVPFGTGRAVGEMQESNKIKFFTYHPQSFYDLKQLVENLPELYKQQEFNHKLPEGLTQYLQSINAEEAFSRILKNTSDYNSFYKMFWHWFDAFTLMKYLHFVRDSFYADMPILEAVQSILPFEIETAKDALIYYRENDVIS